MGKTEPNAALQKAIGCFDTLTEFAFAVGVSYKTVQQWKLNGIPAEHCPKIERVTNGLVKCEQLNDKVDWAFVRANPVEN